MGDDIDEADVYEVEQAIQAAGGFGKFQWLFCTITILCFVPAGFLTFNLNLLTLKQVMQCLNADGDLVNCDDAGIDPCDGRNLKPGAVPDFTDTTSLKNWITELDMYCVAPYQVSLFGSIYFAGYLIGSLLFGYTSKFGRRINLIVSSFCTVATVASIVFITNVYIRYLGMFFLGVWTIQKVAAYIICIEICPFKKQYILATIVLAFDYSPYPISSLYFRFINNNWVYFGYAVIAWTIFLSICSLFVPESPRFLADNGDYEQARKLVDRMARMNGSDMYMKRWRFADEVQTEEDLLKNKKGMIINQSSDKNDENKILLDDEQEDIIAEQLAQKKNPFKQMIQKPRLAINLVILTICWVACCFNFNMLSYNTKNLGGNIFLNSSLIALAGVGGKFITAGIRKYFSSKVSMIICFNVSFIFGFGLIFFNQGWIVSTCIVLVLMGVAGGFTLLFFLNNEFFPPLLVGFAFSVTQAVSRTVTILSYLMTDFKHPIPMILFCSITVAALLPLLFLKKPSYVQNTPS
ncbi:unnamed protein product [Moneuplotes crassus]|uniref:Uncharacterized protein n=1 Tax=Euplotes crassus TaxID=5936 RepID=A0AAD1UAV3_EUPCR|nr:unnamed protein product [Moneuplotes crassus]